MVKNPPAHAGDTRDTGSISGWGSFPKVGNGNPLQYSCLENSMDRGAWRGTVQGVAELDMTECAHTHPIFMSAASPNSGKSVNLDSGSSTGLGSSLPSLGSVPPSSK